MALAYTPATDALHRRSVVRNISVGGLNTDIDHPSPDRRVETDARGVVTTTDYDAWHRPVRVSVVGSELTLDERYEYDATGRVVKHIQKQGEENVTTTY